MSKLIEALGVYKREYRSVKNILNAISTRLHEARETIKRESPILGDMSDQELGEVISFFEWYNDQEELVFALLENSEESQLAIDMLLTEKKKRESAN